MKSSLERLPGSVVKLEVELTQSEFDEHREPLYREALARVEVKGFRPGAAPKALAEAAVNKEEIFSEAANRAVRASLNKLVQENCWTIIDQPEVKIEPADSGFSYKAKLVIFPEVKLRDYQEIARRAFSDSAAALASLQVTDKEVENSLNWLADSRAKTKSVNRQARNNDVVEINFTENGKEGNDRFILGRGHFLPGFEEQINGHRAGDRLNFSLKAPDDYWKKELRGRSIDFRVVVKNVLERELPEINDEFAKSLGRFTTLNDFKKSVSDGLLEEKKLKEKEKVRLAVLKEIAGRAEIDIPQVMFDKMPSKEQVSSHLVVYKIAKEQGLEPTEEEVKAEMSKYQQDRVQLDSNRFYDYIYGIIQSRKVFEFLESL